MKSRNKRQPPKEIVAPTCEQMAGGTFELQEIRDVGPRAAVAIGKAYRRKPMIEILLIASVLNRDEYKALKHYRHHADLADRSPIRDSLCLQRGGRGSGPTISTLNAVRIVTDCERAAGSLADILRAIVVNDWSLAQWAMHRGGSIEVDRKRGVCIEPHKDYLILAKYEIKFAAQRVMSELDAEPLDRRLAA